MPSAVAQPPQQVSFCRSADGARIAYARHGSGPPLVIAVLGDEPAWPVFLDEVAAFLAGDRQPATSAVDIDAASVLSPRELDVLRLAAEGQDNAGIARSLTLSVRTVERHLSNAYTKLGIQGKSARAAAVARLLTRA